MSSTTNNGMEAFRAVRHFLAKREWKVEEIPDASAFKAKVDDELCPRTLFFQVKTEHEQFLFYILPTLTLLPDMLPAIAEFVARANFGMRIGNFELDYRECQVCFRSSVNFKGVPLSEPLIDGVITPALQAFDEFFPGLARVIAGLDTPSKAIRAIEYGE
jgi:hypothetical protein